jgi:hypothetical protein
MSCCDLAILVGLVAAAYVCLYTAYSLQDRNADAPTSKK